MAAMDVDQTGKAGDAMDVDEETPASKQFEELLDKARDLETTNPDQAIVKYKEIIDNKEELDDALCKGREAAINALCSFYVKKGMANEIKAMPENLREVFRNMPKAKSAKLVRSLIEALAKIPGTHASQVEMCQNIVEWCKKDKRTFLRQRVETKLAALLLAVKKYTEAIKLLDTLLSEVKKLDDKLLLVEIHLIECQVYYLLQNIPKSKASLTASKTNANAIHCPPLRQAEIDLWSGIVAAREKDFRTSYSYFYEGFEAYNAAEMAPEAKKCLKFMLLSKIMHKRPQDTKNIIMGKSALKYSGVEIDAMAAVAGAFEDRSLKKFEAIREQFKAQLGDDDIVCWHLTELNETLLEQNILRILEPFCKVEIAHVAELIDLPFDRTQTKLREMILDQKLKGTLDQGVGVLIVFDEEQVRSTYDSALKTIKNTSEVLDTLYGIAKQLP